MLAKLLKYEFKATARIFIPLYVAILGITLSIKVLEALGGKEDSFVLLMVSILIIIFGLSYFVLGIVINFLPLIFIIRRFYKNLLGDEGYLMFTLPVKVWQNTLSKFLLAVFWFIGGIFITTISSISLFNSALNFIMGYIVNKLGITGFITFSIFIIAVISMIILQSYASIAIGHQFTKHKLLASFGAFYVLSHLNSIILSLVSALFDAESTFLAIVKFFLNTKTEPLAVNVAILLLSIFPLIIAIVQFMVTNYILKKKLNLE